MVYYGRTANEHVDVTMALVIEGIPTVFTERTIGGTPTTWNGATQAVCVTRVEEGESTLDFNERRETAATLDVDVLDDGSLTLLFASASRSVSYVSADASASATTINLGSTSNLVAGQAIYIGSETMIVGTVASATQLTGCTRGAYGSKAAALFGTASEGDSVYVRPPSWRGRRAKLYGWGASETLLGTYIVDDAPIQQGDSTWALRMASIAQEYFERVVGLGLRKPFAGGIPVTPGITETDIAIVLQRGGNSAFRTGVDFPTYVLFEYGENPSGTRGPGASIYKLNSVDTLTDYTIFLDVRSLYGTRHMFSGPGPFSRKPCFASPMAIVGGKNAMLHVMLSKEGQAAGGVTYDCLPGRAPTKSEDLGWRLGANFDSSEVDIAAFESFPETESTWVINKERKLTELLREWTLVNGAIIVTTADGKIKPISIAPPRITNSTTIGASSIIPDGAVSVQADEGSIYPRIEIKAGYDPVNDDYVDTFNLIDADMAKRYPRATDVISVEIGSIGIAGEYPRNVSRPPWQNPVSMTPGEMIQFVQSLIKPVQSGRRIVSLSLSHEHLGLRVGDFVTFGTDLPSGFAVPDLRGGTIAGLSGRIISRRPRYDQARVDVQIELLERRLHICPSATLSGAPVGNTIVLNASTVENPLAAPSDHFWVGANVQIVDASQGGGAGAPWGATVTAIPSGTQLTLDAVPTVVADGWTLASGDRVTLHPSNSGLGTSASGYQAVEGAEIQDSDVFYPSNRWV
jgi:hypothetical protein